LATHVRFLVLIICAGLASPMALADTLAGALRRAVAYLPEVSAARANQRAVEETAAQARGLWYPSIDASLGQGRESSNNPSTRALGSDQTLTRKEAEVNLSQLVFDGGATSSQVRRYQARAGAAGDQVANAAESAGTRVVQAYLDVIRLRELIELAVENEKVHRETLAQMSRLADVGQGKRADAQQAEARYALAQASLTQLRAGLAQAEASFQHLTGQQPGVLADPGSFQAKLPATLEAALAQALEEHPAIRSAQKDLLAAQADRESLRSRFVAPRLALELGTSSNHDLDGIPGVNADRYAMLRLRYNLFRGGIDDSRVREAEARADEALANYARARNDTERDLRQTWQVLAEDRNRMPQLQRYAEASAQVVRSYRLQFSIGQRTLLDVLNAENELFTARSNQYTVASAVTLGELRLLATMGKLLETLGVEINPAPQSPGTKQATQTAAAVPESASKAAPAQQNEQAVDTKQDQAESTVALRMSMTLGSVEAAR
jgi:outer membrane protein, adhesin transport system